MPAVVIAAIKAAHPKWGKAIEYKCLQDTAIVQRQALVRTREAQGAGRPPLPVRKDLAEAHVAIKCDAPVHYHARVETRARPRRARAR